MFFYVSSIETSIETSQLQHKSHCYSDNQQRYDKLSQHTMIIACFLPHVVMGFETTLNRNMQVFSYLISKTNLMKSIPHQTIEEFNYLYNFVFGITV